MVSSLFQIVIGLTGLIGFFLRFIGPLTVAPTIILVGVALSNVAAEHAGKYHSYHLPVEPRFHQVPRDEGKVACQIEGSLYRKPRSNRFVEKQPNCSLYRDIIIIPIFLMP